MVFHILVFQGQLKEKKGKWKFFKRWKTRYFTLSGAQITYNKNDSVCTPFFRSMAHSGKISTVNSQLFWKLIKNDNFNGLAVA